MVSSPVGTTGLVCEYLTNPIAVDTMAPRLSWALTSVERGQTQSAYQIVATSNGAPLWDTGKVASRQQTHVPYAGPTLTSRQRVEWKVRIWDGSDRASVWSEPASWEMGLLSAEDWKGKWIAGSTELTTPSAPAPYLRKTFMVEKPIASARAYAAGVGFIELSLNGAKVSDHVLDPGYTRFDRRVIYATYDITAGLAQGANTVGVVLGNGWLNVNANDVWDFDAAPWRQTPRALVQLHIDFQDGTSQLVVSDESWRRSTGAIVFDGIRNGQSDDARLEKDGWSTATYVEDASWSPAHVVQGPGGVLSAQMFPPQKVMQTLTAKSIEEPSPGVFVLDFGQNAAGFAKLNASGPAGTKITLRYAEKLNEQGGIDQSTVSGVGGFNFYDGPFQTDSYVLRGGGTESWQPRFAIHGFQYIEVTGFPGTPTAQNVQMQVVHTAFETIGEFTCSNELFNRIQSATQWSYTANFQGIPTDCPHREKNGWLGDAHLAGELAMLNFQNGAAYTKWIRDLKDEMRPSGELPGIVPTPGWGYTDYNGPAWQSALLLLPWYMYQYTGDTQILTSSYEYFQRYLAFLGGFDYLSQNPTAWLGDTLPPTVSTPEGVTHAGYHAVDARIAAKTAELLGNAADAQKYRELAEQVRQAFLAKYFDASSGQVATGSQTALAAALYQELLDEADRPRVEQLLIDNVNAHQQHLDTGTLGTKYLPWALTRAGRADLFYEIANQTDFPSWGLWLNQGATTLWESWNDNGSRNHVFLGDISAWFMRALAGINPDAEAPGFEHVIIRPEVVGDLTFARGSTRTLRGLIKSEWQFLDAKWVLDVEIPVNSRGTVFVPAASRESVIAEGATFVRSEQDRQVFSIGSGSYRFEASL